MRIILYFYVQKLGKTSNFVCFISGLYIENMHKSTKKDKKLLKVPNSETHMLKKWKIIDKLLTICRKKTYNLPMG